VGDFLLYVSRFACSFMMKLVAAKVMNDSILNVDNEIFSC
jgi:hypothetical protein